MKETSIGDSSADITEGTHRQSCQAWHDPYPFEQLGLHMEYFEDECVGVSSSLGHSCLLVAITDRPG